MRAPPLKNTSFFKGGYTHHYYLIFSMLHLKKKQACTPPSQNSREKNSEHGKHERTRKLLYGSKQLLTDNNYSQGLNVKEIKMLSLCLPFMGFACGKSLLMRVLLFSGKPWGLPKKMSLTQREPLRKDKIRGQNSSLRS